MTLYTRDTFLLFGNATALLKVFAVRQDGYDGPIEILPADGQDGLTIQGGTIPAGEDSVCLTVSLAPSFWPKGAEQPNGKMAFSPKTLRLVGKMADSAETVPVRALEDQEQAFIYHHLMELDEIEARFRGGRKPQFELISPAPLVFRNGVAELEMGVEFRPPNPKKPKAKPVRMSFNKETDFRLSPESAAFTLENAQFDQSVFKATVRITDPEKAAKQGNLILEIRQPWQIKDAEGKPKPPSSPFGWLPAVPYRVE